MRKKLFEIIEVADEKNKLSHVYDVFMIVAILASLMPLTMKEPPQFFIFVERITTVIFIIDYILRLFTADIKLGRGWLSFLIYPFTFTAIIDVLSILPSLLSINETLRVLRAVRLIKALRVLKIIRGFRYSKNIAIIVAVFKKQKRSLTTVCAFALGYIAISALVIFNVEPETFENFFEAVYWATVSLTTVGYGDIYTTSVIGRMITMISAVLGVAIVALPAGIITAGYMGEIQAEDSADRDKKDKE